MNLNQKKSAGKYWILAKLLQKYVEEAETELVKLKPAKQKLKLAK